MLPVIFGFTRYETDPTPGLAIQWWSVTDSTVPPDPYVPDPDRYIRVPPGRRKRLVEVDPS